MQSKWVDQFVGLAILTTAELSFYKLKHLIVVPPNVTYYRSIVAKSYYQIVASVIERLNLLETQALER